jgi:flagella basal body P-ring formation protein FlgA
MINLFRLMFTISFLAVNCGDVLAVTLRDTTLIHSHDVRISDLFDNAGFVGERVLGAGPLPGTRIVIEAAQAAAIARKFGLIWQPASSGERVVIERPGRQLTRDDVDPSIRSALASKGAPVSSALEMPGFSPPIVSAEGTVSLIVEQPDYEPLSGRFTGTLVISGTDGPVQRLRISGRAIELVEVFVPLRHLAVGSILHREDFQTSHQRPGAWRGEIAHFADEIVGQAARRTLGPGQPILISDVGRPMVVQKGTRVLMMLQSPGLSMTTVGYTVGPAALGDRVMVVNMASGASVEAEVVSADVVRVDPRSAPVWPLRATNPRISQQ